MQSIATQTLRTKPDPGDFVQAFSARLASLAGAHNLLTRAEWQGANLRDIVDAALAPFRIGEATIEVSGPPVMIPANATITLSLMLHELATNAAKYGALSKPRGHVTIGWHLAETAQDAMIDLRWVERDGPCVQAPLQPGFGTRLLEASAAQLDGAVTLDYAAEGVCCRLRFRLPKSGPLRVL